jgi:hypothetical protein
MQLLYICWSGGFELANSVSKAADKKTQTRFACPGLIPVAVPGSPVSGLTRQHHVMRVAFYAQDFVCHRRVLEYDAYHTTAVGR